MIVAFSPVIRYYFHKPSVHFSFSICFVTNLFGVSDGFTFIYFCELYYTRPKGTTEDYKLRYRNHFLHKPSLALKQNGINFEENLQTFLNRNKSKIDEVVIIGFSFGESDAHIYNLIHDLFIDQKSEANMYHKSVEKIKKIKIKIFSYDDKETDSIINRMKVKMENTNKRRFTVNKTGVGFHPQKEDIIVFEKISYS